jgi:hypothetical protein
MAYDGNNLSILNQTTNGGFKVWVYKSADTFATVKASHFITDALARGMNVRDVVYVVDTTTPATTMANILTVTSSGDTMSSTGVVIAE